MKRFACVRLEFAHAIGPDAGRYVVRPPDGVSLRGADPLDVAAIYGKGDVLDIGVADAPRAFGRRRKKKSDPDVIEQVRIARVTYVWGTRPLSREEAADDLAQLDEDEDEAVRRIEQAIAALNVAIRAHRVTVSDPFISEVTVYDPRSVVFAYGKAETLIHHDYEDTWTPPRDADFGAQHTADAGEVIAATLAGEHRVLEADEFVLRIALDLHQGRHRAAAAGVRALADVVEHELRSLDGGPAVGPELLVRARETGLAVLTEPSNAGGVERLVEAARDLQSGLRSARAQGVGQLDAAG